MAARASPSRVRVMNLVFILMSNAIVTGIERKIAAARLVLERDARSAVALDRRFFENRLPRETSFPIQALLGPGAILRVFLKHAAITISAKPNSANVPGSGAAAGEAGVAFIWNVFPWNAFHP